MTVSKFVAMSICITAGLSIVACSKSDSGTAAKTAGVKEVAEHDHEGWWCNEHGVPEEVCAQCDAKLVADFKAKGDWCDKHNRPESQCFICHPEKEAEFAALYEAKYGKKPPKPEAGGDEQEKEAAPKAS
jgi:cobalt-zinc-cadmium efflux system membrane fusion protein